MSYVPPHLRSSTISKPTTFTNLETSTTSTTQSQNFNSHSSQLHQFKNTAAVTITPNGSSKNNNSTSSFSNAALRNSVNVVPDPVFAQWKPSERVFRLTPEQTEEVRLRLNVDVTVPSESSPAPAPIESFTDMCLHSSIMKDITFHEYSTPTSIQAQAMPVALSGRDLLGCAETGSGKTAAFTIPMIQHCLAQPPIRRGDGPLALVLAPTRELAQQIEKEVKAFSRSLESFKTAIVVGGTNIAEQRSELRSGVNIVVATPGRLIDHLQQGNTSLSRVTYVVLDEADRMLDMGFEPQIKEVMRNLPEKYQTLLFSATMPVEIESLAQEYLTDPVRVKVGKVSSPTANVAQVLEKVSDDEKIDRLLALLVEESTQAERSNHPLPLTIVFVERKTRCDEVAEALVAQGLRAVSLHGGRSQSEREAALRVFRNGSTNILVATDVASRGLDVTGVAHVVNLDLPKDGIFISQSKYIKELLKRFGMEESKVKRVPMSQATKLDQDINGLNVDAKLYRGMIGGLLYLTASRPDILLSVGICARFQANPKESHLKAVKDILKYLKATTNLGLWYPKDTSFSVVAYTDAHFAGSKTDRKSTSGNCFFIRNCLTSWMSKKQNSISLSTTEAEYIAVESCCAQILWMKQLIKDFDEDIGTIPIMCDNTSAINISKNPNLHSRTKHIDIRHHFLREQVANGNVKLEYVQIEDQIVDIFTKPLGEDQFNKLQQLLGVEDNPIPC